METSGKTNTVAEYLAKLEADCVEWKRKRDVERARQLYLELAVRADYFAERERESAY